MLRITFCSRVSQSQMELLNAIEEFEQPTSIGLERDADYVELQVQFVQQQLRNFWQRKYGNDAMIPRVPFYWVFSGLLRLLEEYPDGLTEAVVVTELATLFERKVAQDSEKVLKTGRKKRKIRDEEDVEELLAEEEEEGLSAKVIGYGDHRVTLEIQQAHDLVAHMYLHQRYRHCVDFLHHNLHYDQTSYPFQIAREVTFTKAKLLERKEVNMTRDTTNDNQVLVTLLPTPFLVPRLETSWPLDQKLLADAMELTRADQVITQAQAPAVMQQLILKAKVLDISAIRSCQTPLYLHRQVILLGEVDESLNQGVHLLVLWDDQVALSQLFRIGDTLVLFHPFVHICDESEVEMQAILADYASLERLGYYLEYGSATVLFAQPRQVAASLQMAPIAQSHCELERPYRQFKEIPSGWRTFSLYAHVRRIQVSHGLPLLAVFFSAYYDPKMNQSRDGTLARPPCNRFIVDKYSLVVKLEVYLASASNQVLTIEVTGEMAKKALRLFPGQSVFLDGLVAIDMASKAIQHYRHLPTNPPPPTCRAFAFPTQAYTKSPSSSLVALCSDWEKIFGHQSLFRTRSKLTIVNTTLGLFKTELHRSIEMWTTTAAPPLAIVEMTIGAGGWLIPSSKGWRLDVSCAKGLATTYVHQACFRPLKLMPRDPVRAKLPKWQCLFCREMFVGVKDTLHTYREVAVVLETGHSSVSPVFAVCQGDVIETLLQCSSMDYMQLPLQEKRRTLARMMGQTFRLVLSRCEPRHVSMPPSLVSELSLQTESSVSMHVRMDMVEPLNAFKAAHRLLAAVRQ